MRHLRWISSPFCPQRRISVTVCLSVFQLPECQASRVVLVYSKRTSLTDNVFALLPKTPGPHFLHRDPFSSG
ncbi:unnamed protein product [Protopolystoma xenopodis]|uniref:Uncharacterized protein n=1 Tax=Protopolystoma xenopodis TaxID=117903 RepID=A0A448XRH1_9PLAT|nr:unnamed protein product [Protopolystoma xenopodis]